MSSRNRRIVAKIPDSRNSASLRNLPDAAVGLDAGRAPELNASSVSQSFKLPLNWEQSYHQNVAESSSHECSSLSVTNSTVRGTSSSSSWTDDEAFSTAKMQTTKWNVFETLGCTSSLLLKMLKTKFTNLETCTESTPHTRTHSQNNTKFKILLKILRGIFVKECEKNATQSLQCMLDELDAIMYENSYSSCSNASLISEILHWTKHFPHFRIVGKKFPASCLDLLPPSNQNILPPSPSTPEEISSNDTIQNLCLEVQGVALNSALPAEHSASLECSDELHEEIILQHGIYEEYTSAHTSDEINRELNDADVENLSSNEDEQIHSKALKEKIMNILIEDIWDQVIVHITNFLLPEDQNKSVTVPIDHREEFMPVRLRRGKCSSAVARFSTSQPTDLQGILQVSSKVLMNRGPLNPRVTSTKVGRRQNVISMQQKAWTNCKYSSRGRLAPLQQSPFNFVPLSANGLKDCKSVGTFLPLSPPWGRNSSLPPIDPFESATQGTTVVKVPSPRMSSAFLEPPNTSLGQLKTENLSAHSLQSNWSPTSTNSATRPFQHANKTQDKVSRIRPITSRIEYSRFGTAKPRYSTPKN